MGSDGGLDLRGFLGVSMTHKRIKTILWGVFGIGLGLIFCVGGSYFGYESFVEYMKYKEPPRRLDLKQDQELYKDNVDWVELFGYTPQCHLHKKQVYRRRATFYMPVTNPASNIIVLVKNDEPIPCDPTGNTGLRGSISGGQGTSLIEEYRSTIANYVPGKIYHLCAYCGPGNSIMGLFMAPIFFLGGTILLAGGVFSFQGRELKRKRRR